MPVFAALLSMLMNLLSPVGVGVTPGYHLAPDAQSKPLDVLINPLDVLINPL
jgi:hypothetical protein